MASVLERPEDDDFYNPAPEEIARDEIKRWYMKALEANIILEAEEDRSVDDWKVTQISGGIHLRYTVQLPADCGKTEFALTGANGVDEIDLSDFDQPTKWRALKAIQRVRQFVTAVEDGAAADLEKATRRYCQALLIEASHQTDAQNVPVFAAETSTNPISSSRPPT
jgi:hypothetical protein